MHTKDVLDRVLGFIQELTAFYAELSEELPNLRVVVDNTRTQDFSELKKIPRTLFRSSGLRKNTKEILIT